MISDLLRKLSSYLSFFYVNRPSNPIKNKKILNEINLRLIKNKYSNLNLKKTHIRFNSQIYNLLKKNKIENFLRYSFVQKMFFIHNRFFIYDELKFLKKSQEWGLYKKLLVEDDVGDPVRYFLYPTSSGNKINHIFHLSQLVNEFNVDLKNIKRVFEFGSGYGCMARIFSKINRQIKYMCFDTYNVNLLQFYYLKYNNLNVGFSKNNDFHLNSNFNKIKYDDYRYNDLFIANWSISETPINFRKNFEIIIGSSKYVLIGFQEIFESVNNLNYFKTLKNKISKRYKVKIIENQFYKGNFMKKQKHYYFLAKKII
tara:strand:- start:5548 stop:6486 length:939 start_codon:yes stop_codon:yes gene_type:complete